MEKHFDEDTVRREQELAQIEQRLAKLRELLDRRRASKRDILELQTRVALNEAEGLGFYGGEAPADPHQRQPSAYSIPGALPALDPTLIRQ